MEEHRELLDAFAEARRTWDDLVTLQPDIVAGSARARIDLAELERRVNMHREAIDMLADALAFETAETDAEIHDGPSRDS
jgi:hypothetical protein